ncbi:hypothetical protein J2W17_003857 [Pseudomonas lini]|jgi:hypothetical protein|nr:hypothetical protein [Pseudomonas lini]
MHRRTLLATDLIWVLLWLVLIFLTILGTG